MLAFCYSQKTTILGIFWDIIQLSINKTNGKCEIWRIIVYNRVQLYIKHVLMILLLFPRLIVLDRIEFLFVITSLSCYLCFNNVTRGAILFFFFLFFCPESLVWWPLPVKGYILNVGLCSAPTVREQGWIFIVSHLLWYWTSLLQLSALKQSWKFTILYTYRDTRLHARIFSPPK